MDDKQFDGAYHLLAHLLGNKWMAIWIDYLEAGAPFGFKERHVVLWAKYGTRTTTS